MSRCDHGFERSVVSCPECDGHQPLTQGRGRARARTDEEIIQALESSGNAKKAAEKLGYATADAIYERAKVSEKVRAVLYKGRPIRDGKPAHRGFRDMTGKVVGTWTVIERGENSGNGTARWRCRHTCGAVHLLEGVLLRSKPPKFCSNCRPPRKGPNPL